MSTGPVDSRRSLTFLNVATVDHRVVHFDSSFEVLAALRRQPSSASFARPRAKACLHVNELPVIVVMAGIRCTATFLFRSRGQRAVRHACRDSGDRHPEKVIIIARRMRRGGRLRRIGQAEQVGRMRAMAHLAHLGH